MKKTIIISSCLLGINSRYDGTNAYREEIMKKYAHECLIPLCPEQLGGLPTPRPQAEIRVERVIDINGKDVTVEFNKGAHEVLKIAKLLHVQKAVLKEKSPSCGVNIICRNGELVNGMGITARLLQKNGVQVEGVN